MRHRPWLLVLIWLVCITATIAAPFWFTWLLTRTGYAGTILVLAGLYVGLHWLMEPFRPPWEASLFGTRGASRIRRRRWFNPTQCPVCGREDRNCQGRMTSDCGPGFRVERSDDAA